MNQDSPSQSDSSPPNDPNSSSSRKRRRRRRGKPKAGGDNRPAPATVQSETSPDQSDTRDPGTGYRGKDTKAKKPRRGQDESRPQAPAGRDGGGKNRDRQSSTTRADADNAQGGRGGQKPKQKKRRKPRTKQCVHCYTPCTTIHRVKLDYRKQWAFICDVCWPTRCIDNPHYEYGGLWVTGRVMKPESGE